MTFKHEIIATDNFFREAKALSKKYRSLKQDLSRLEADLLQNPFSGTDLGNSTYKVRFAIKSKGKGKSGGARVITYLVEKVADDPNTILIFLLSIYDKSDTSSISEARIAFLIDQARSAFLEAPDE